MELFYLSLIDEGKRFRKNNLNSEFSHQRPVILLPDRFDCCAALLDTEAKLSRV